MAQGSGPLAWLMKKLHGPVYRARLRELVRGIHPHLRTGDSVLDVGCGYGALGRALRDDPQCPADVSITGLERVKRGDEAIEVREYDGVTIPYEDNTFDVVILADVLHHEENPDRLIAECRRVCARLLIIKDHKIDGPLAQPRIAFMDWAANNPYGVPCLYRYHTHEQWKRLHQRHQLTVVEERTAMNLYPPGYNLIFGRRLQYLAVLAKATEPPATPPSGDQQ